RQDFYDEFPFYLEIRVGRASLPTRSDVIRIASFLNCSLPERNKLLISANYAPIIDNIEGEQLTSALETAQRILDFLPFPAFAITRDDTVHCWNKLGTVLFNISDQELKQTPLEERNILRYIFDPNTPVYTLLTNGRRDFRWWRYTAK